MQKLSAGKFHSRRCRSARTAGPGSPPDLLGRLLRTDTGTQFALVAYRGTAPAMQDVIAGQIDAVFITVAAALPQDADRGPSCR
jgi:tripartite-type tricarboxylate transporter receptor subunit TctC